LTKKKDPDAPFTNIGSTSAGFLYSLALQEARWKPRMLTPIQNSSFSRSVLLVVQSSSH
jgi:hypothetical protein